MSCCASQGHSLTFPFGATQGNQQDALIATVIVGLCNHFSTYISFWLADHFGRRFLFIECATSTPEAVLFQGCLMQDALTDP